MTVSVTGSAAPASRLTLFRALHTTSESTQFGAALWRQGFLYVVESRHVPAWILTLSDPHGRRRRLREHPVTTETMTDFSMAVARFERLMEEQLLNDQLLYSFARPSSLDDGSLARAVLDGIADIIDALTMAELVRQIYPATDEVVREQILAFVRDAPLTWGCWAGWKWLLKQAEAITDVELLAVAYARLEYEPAWLEPAVATPVPFVDRYPSPQTIRYLQRRMRRYQKHLYVSNRDAWDTFYLEPPQPPSPADTPLAEDESIVETAPAADPHEMLIAAITSGTAINAYAISSLYWATDARAESRTAVLATLEQLLVSDIDRALPVIEALSRRMAMSQGPDFEPARRGVSNLLVDGFDAATSVQARVALAGCAWQSGDAVLTERIHAEMMRASLVDLPLWVAALRTAAPPNVSAMLADVEARIRFTVWDPGDLRLVAPLVMSLDEPDLHDRVVDLIPDWFLTDEMDLIDLFEHPIPKIAAWAKRQANEAGVPGRSLLRLVESNRRDDLALLAHGTRKLPAGDPELFPCVEQFLGDSRPMVRRLGIDLAQRYLAALPPRPAVLALARTRDRAAWSLALEILQQAPDVAADVPAFVESALRGRWATTRQRATLMGLLESAPQRYVEPLLAVARSGWPIHQEWALRLLIDVARDGIEVPGFALTGEQDLSP